MGHKNLKKLYQFVNHEKMPYEPLMSYALMKILFLKIHWFFWRVKFGQTKALEMDINKSSSQTKIWLQLQPPYA